MTNTIIAIAIDTHHALRLYLTLTKIEYQLVGIDLTNHIKSKLDYYLDLNDMINPTDQLFDYCCRRNMTQHIRVMLDNGYTPCNNQLISLASSGICSIFLTLSLSWTITQRLLLTQRLRDKWILYYDSNYREHMMIVSQYVSQLGSSHLLYGMRSYPTIPDNQRPTIVYTRFGLYYSLILDYVDDRMSTFIELIERDITLTYCCDPRLENDWKALVNDWEILVADRQLSRVKNPHISSYIHSLGLNGCDRIDTSDNNLSNLQLLKSVQRGLPINNLPPDHPLVEMIRCRTTKRSRGV